MKKIILKIIVAIVLTSVELIMAKVYFIFGSGLLNVSNIPLWFLVLSSIIGNRGTYFITMASRNWYLGEQMVFYLLILFLFLFNYLIVSLFEHFYWDRRETYS